MRLPTLLAAACALWLSACVEEPAPPAPGGGAGGLEPECRVDADCEGGAPCELGTCGEPPAVRCTFEDDPTCTDGTICVARVDSLCVGEGACIVDGACTAPVGERGGGYSCSSAGDCRSGLCLDGLCLALCVTAADCEGLDCVDLPLPRGGVTRSCSPTDAGGLVDPGTPRCDGDSDCGEGQVCRRVIGDPVDPRSIARCAPRDPARKEARLHCAWGGIFGDAASTGTPEALAADDSCQHGDCQSTCGVGGVSLCYVARCVQPCGSTQECPDRYVCAPMQAVFVDYPRPYRFCQPPPRGCLSELDCCPSSDATGCVDSWELTPTHCRPSVEGGRLLTTCVAPEGRLAPGESCANDEECGSGLCLSDAPGPDGPRQACGRLCDEFFPRGCPRDTGVDGARCAKVERVLDGVPVSVPVCVSP